MCLIVARTENTGVFTEEQFKKSFVRNDDGLGIMWAENGRVNVAKKLGTLEEQLAEFMKYQDKESAVFHMRFATHGKADMLANCHPYRILSLDEGDPIDLWLMHNGVITGIFMVDNAMSDTFNFAEHYIRRTLKMMPDPLVALNDKFFLDLLGNAIGTGSKLVMLDGEGNQYFVNKTQGTMRDGLWYSNTGAFPVANTGGYTYENGVYTYYGTGHNRHNDSQKKTDTSNPNSGCQLPANYRANNSAANGGRSAGSQGGVQHSTLDAPEGGFVDYLFYTGVGRGYYYDGKFYETRWEMRNKIMTENEKAIFENDAHLSNLADKLLDVYTGTDTHAAKEEFLDFFMGLSHKDKLGVAQMFPEFAVDLLEHLMDEYMPAEDDVDDTEEEYTQEFEAKTEDNKIPDSNATARGGAEDTTGNAEVAA